MTDQQADKICNAIRSLCVAIACGSLVIELGLIAIAWK